MIAEAKRGRVRTWRRMVNLAATAVAALFSCVHAAPAMLFPHAITVDRVTVRSRAPLPPETATRIGEALELVRKSELYVPDRAEHIFICNNHALYVALGPGHGGSFAFSMPLTDNVFINDADVANDVVRRAGEQYNRRSFSRVAAHEITHGLIRKRLGLIRGVALRTWVAEGYADYIAGESSFPEDEGRKLLASGGDDGSESFRYFTARMMVQHLIDDQHLTFEQVVARAGEYDAVKAETIAALNAR